MRFVSILIPARDEEQSIEACVRAALANDCVALEVIVGDDHSQDRTAEIVRGIAAEDARLRLISIPPLPFGWCGKQFACEQLAGAARYDTLCFLDADVRLSPSGIAGMVETLRIRRVSLLSGFPKQDTVKWLEQALIPLMHFLLLGFLPMVGMKKTGKPAFAAGCGQIFVADAKDYRRAGGHAAIRESRHDGITLPRAFRRAGFMTDLCDATHVANCRMYRSNREVVRGLLKNATEGLASATRILPFSFLLFFGQVCPILLLGWSLLRGYGHLLTGIAALALVLSYLPRIVSVRKFQQPLSGALLHPLAVAILLGIQWYAFILSIAGVPSVWKGRSYSTHDARDWR